MLDPRYNPPYRLPKNPRDWIDPRRIEMQLNRQRTLEQARKNPNDPMNWRNPQSNEMRLNHLRTSEQNKNNLNDPMNWRNPPLSPLPTNQKDLKNILKTYFQKFENKGGNVLNAPANKPKAPYGLRITGIVTNYRTETFGKGSTSHYFTIGTESGGVEVEFVQNQLDPTLGNSMEQITFFEERYQEYLDYRDWQYEIEFWHDWYGLQAAILMPYVTVQSLIATLKYPDEVYVDVNPNNYKATDETGYWGYL